MHVLGARNGLISDLLLRLQHFLALLCDVQKKDAGQRWRLQRETGRKGERGIDLGLRLEGRKEGTMDNARPDRNDPFPHSLSPFALRHFIVRRYNRV